MISEHITDFTPTSYEEGSVELPKAKRLAKGKGSKDSRQPSLTHMSMKEEVKVLTVLYKAKPPVNVAPQIEDPTISRSTTPFNGSKKTHPRPVDSPPMRRTRSKLDLSQKGTS